ncbi:hypothetical protein M3649_03785 [Ureibacillus chungkukjangi]|uniref:hypothetical protein n=1 Tax=Ureibacillus chungkukjangi TaxID=1202712 RepID=UPI00203E663A|nr:hypothetical protein [Ureibacillus chungkukjangi]MCM3387252.1 hypothetical protein [Ureibacillus chungkukjangi]
MLDKNTIGVIQQWEWASEHPYLYALIEISPPTIVLMIMLCILKLGTSVLKGNKR